MARKRKDAGVDLGRRRLLKTGAAAGLVGGAMAAGLPLRPARAKTDTIRIGYLTSITGPRAAFSEPAEWNLGKIREALKNGLQIGGKTYQVEILMRDTQSTPTRAGSVGSDLVLREQVDLLLGDDGDSHYAVGELCDQVGLPFMSTMTQWEPFLNARSSSPEKGYPWTYLFFWGARDIGVNYVAQWNQLQTNKVVGDLYLDHPAGQAFADLETGIPAAMQASGYTRSAGGFYRPDTDDFSNQVAQFKAAGTGIVTGFLFPPHFVTFWNQAAQAGLKPEICTVAAAFLFPSGVEALGDRGDGMSTEVWWTPNVPFASSLTGQSARQVADQWQADTGRQWTQPLGYMHALFEVGVAMLKNAGDPLDREAVRKATDNLSVDTLVGPVNFRDSKIRNVAVTQMAMGQWRKTAGGPFPYDLKITWNATAPDIHPETELVPLSKLA